MVEILRRYRKVEFCGTGYARKILLRCFALTRKLALRRMDPKRLRIFAPRIPKFSLPEYANFIFKKHRWRRGGEALSPMRSSYPPQHTFLPAVWIARTGTAAPTQLKARKLLDGYSRTTGHIVLMLGPCGDPGLERRRLPEPLCGLASGVLRVDADYVAPFS